MRTRAPVYKAPQPAPVHGWTGCYIGGNVGYGWARQGFIDPPEGVVDGSTAVDLGAHTADGVVGGGQIGCDYQTGPWVLGVQGMFDGQILRSDGLAAAASTLATECFERLVATLTDRIGYTVQPGVWPRGVRCVGAGMSSVVNTDSGM
jgi:outer membrane immunogenic protein